LSKEESRYISDSLVHFRNNLCISEGFANEISDESIVTVSNIVRPNSFVGNFTYHRSDIGSHLSKNCILWNLFTLGIDRLLINLLAHAEKVRP
jgi:copper homeostasis protein CutC